MLHVICTGIYVTCEVKIYWVKISLYLSQLYFGMTFHKSECQRKSRCPDLSFKRNTIWFQIHQAQQGKAPPVHISSVLWRYRISFIQVKVFWSWGVFKDHSCLYTQLLQDFITCTFQVKGKMLLKSSPISGQCQLAGWVRNGMEGLWTIHFTPSVPISSALWQYRHSFK